MAVRYRVMSVVRIAKNFTMGYSSTEVKTRAATTNEPWGPTTQEMAEISNLSYNRRDFQDIVKTLGKRLNDKGRNWRHVYKALVILDHLLHNGSYRIIQYALSNMFIIDTLSQFQHIDEGGKDCGLFVRRKAREISNMLCRLDSLIDERTRTLRGPESVEENVEDTLDDQELRDLRRAVRESFISEQLRARASEQESQDIELAIQLSKESYNKSDSSPADAPVQTIGTLIDLFDDKEDQGYEKGIPQSITDLKDLYGQEFSSKNIPRTQQPKVSIVSDPFDGLIDDLVISNKQDNHDKFSDDELFSEIKNERAAWM